MGIPSRFMISDDPIDNLRNIDKAKIRIDPMGKLKSIAQKNKIPYVDLKKSLVREREKMISGQIDWNDLYIRNDYAHLNERGHELAAELALLVGHLQHPDSGQWPGLFQSVLSLIVSSHGRASLI